MTEKLALVLPDGYSVTDPTGFKFKTGNISDIISALLPYVFVLAGLIFFLYLLREYPS